jgi:fatty-acyl-CoA synthase
LEGKTLSSTIAKLNAPLTQAFDPRLLNESPIAITPTPTYNTQDQRLADFETLTAALEYAAAGVAGFNFYDAKGNLRSILPYRALKQNAQTSARRLMGMGLTSGNRVAIIADTTPEFVELFFACRYAGLVPFAMPVPVNLGSHAVYVQQLRGMLDAGQASAAIANVDYINFLSEAAEGSQGLRWVGTPEQLGKFAASDIALPVNTPEEIAYLQFTSGSTRIPRGVIITEHALMSNLQGIVRHGLEIRAGDRCASWLPFYHDMGLVGMVMAPMVAQVSVDYLATRDLQSGLCSGCD